MFRSHRNDALFLDKNKLSGDWTGAACVHDLHLQPLEASVHASQLLRERPRGDGTHLPPPVGLPTGTSAGATGLLALRPGEMAAELLFDFGLVLVDADDLPPLGPTTATHRALEGERRGEGRGRREK